MQIDWVTVAAQIVNFLILIWLLQRVLYRPLARALKAREEAVTQRLDNAEAARKNANAEAAAHHLAIQTIEQEREARLKAADHEAAARHAQLVEDAHKEQEKLRNNWRSQLEEEKTAFLEQLRRKAGESFANMARTVLMEMADTELVERLVKVFVRRLTALDAETKIQLQTAARHAGRVQIFSSMPLAANLRSDIVSALTAIMDGEMSVDFHENPAIECGIVLQAGSRRAGWTLEGHLDRFEDDVTRVLDAATGAGRES